MKKKTLENKDKEKKGKRVNTRNEKALTSEEKTLENKNKENIRCKTRFQESPEDKYFLILSDISYHNLRLIERIANIYEIGHLGTEKDETIERKKNQNK